MPTLWVVISVAVCVAVGAALGYGLAWWGRLTTPSLLPEPPMTETDVLALLATHARCCSHGSAETKALLSHYVTRVDRDDELAAHVRLDALGPHVADHLRYYLASEEFRARLVLIMREEWQRPPAFMGQHLATSAPARAVKTPAKLPKSAPKRGRK